MRLGYSRISGVDKTTDRQLDGIGLDRTFEDTRSGNSTNRPALDRLKDYAQVGDTVVVHAISRLAHNVDDLIGRLKFFNGKKVTVEFRKEALTFTANETKPANRLMLSCWKLFISLSVKWCWSVSVKASRKPSKLESTGANKTALTAKPSGLALIENEHCRTANYLGISVGSVQKIKKKR